MSVEASDSLSEVWTRWQGHVINGAFEVGRCLGSSEHSGVFLTRSAARDSAEVAIKLVPTNRALAESLLPRWKRAGGLAHPHLLPLLQWGGCQFEGLPYLYALMEYADQTLAELLLHRALTDEEVREMLPPLVGALTSLHRQDLVQGQLKPTNILVVGDQVKLASDTVRRLSDPRISAHALTAYDPPEARQGITSAAGDVWALGVTLFEALTRRLPPALGESSAAVVLPADFSPAFRDVVQRCLSRNPQDRPGVAEVAALTGGRPAEAMPAATVESAPLVPGSATPEAATPEAAAPEPTAREVTQEGATLELSTLELSSLAPGSTEPVTLELVTAEPVTPEPMAPEPMAPEPMKAEPAGPATFAAQRTPAGEPPARAFEEFLKARPLPTAIVAALVILLLVWAGVRSLSPRRVPAPAAPAAAAPAAPPPVQTAAPVAAGPAAKPPRSAAVAAPAALHEVIPDVPAGARRTVRGHIKVWVRVIVNPDGSVFAAVPDRAGPSRYFQRLALDAARKWTFPPADTSSQRLMQIRFDFSREGTTGRAVTLH